eukprot:4612982-Pyramimonas_sp.AAC.1
MSGNLGLFSGTGQAPEWRGLVSPDRHYSVQFLGFGQVGARGHAGVVYSVSLAQLISGEGLAACDACTCSRRNSDNTSCSFAAIKQATHKWPNEALGRGDSGVTHRETVHVGPSPSRPVIRTGGAVHSAYYRV